jgi:hypothetical protein
MTGIYALNLVVELREIIEKYPKIVAICVFIE